MSSSLEGNKTIAAVLTAGVMAVGAGVVSSIIYAPADLEEYAYSVELPEDDGADSVEEVVVVPLPVLLASADAAAGEGVAKKCTACHVFEEGGANKIGPGLHGIVGQDIAAVAGFDYSEALTGLEGTWDYAALDGFLADPKGYAAGTKMSFAGVKKPDERADLILYLRSVSPDAPDLPAPEADAAEAAPEVETEVAEAVAEASTETVDAATETPAEADVTAEVAEEAVEAEADVASADTATETPAEAVAPVETAEEVVADVVVAEEAVEAEAPVEEAPVEAKAVTEAAEAPVETVVAAVDTSATAIAGDAAAGEKTARRCQACHDFTENGEAKIGPALWGIVGQDIASAEGFKYSEALVSKDGVWDAANLDAFLAAPKDWAEGTKMAFAGLRKEEDRANIIAYLNSLSN